LGFVGLIEEYEQFGNAGNCLSPSKPWAVNINKMDAGILKGNIRSGTDEYDFSALDLAVREQNQEIAKELFSRGSK
jgi:hypothetical protein